MKQPSLPFSHHGWTAIQRSSDWLFEFSNHLICLSQDRGLFGDLVILSGNKYHHKDDCLLHDLLEKLVAHSPPVFFQCHTFTACSIVLFSRFITKKRFFSFFFVKFYTVKDFFFGFFSFFFFWLFYFSFFLVFLILM